MGSFIDEFVRSSDSWTAWIVNLSSFTPDDLLQCDLYSCWIDLHYIAACFQLLSLIFPTEGIWSPNLSREQE